MSGILVNEWDIVKPGYRFYKNNVVFYLLLFISQNIFCRIENLFPKSLQKVYENP